MLRLDAVVVACTGSHEKFGVFEVVPDGLSTMGCPPIFMLAGVVNRLTWPDWLIVRTRHVYSPSDNTAGGLKLLVVTIDLNTIVPSFGFLTSIS